MTYETEPFQRRDIATVLVFEQTPNKLPPQILLVTLDPTAVEPDILHHTFDQDKRVFMLVLPFMDVTVVWTLAPELDQDSAVQLLDLVLFKVVIYLGQSIQCIVDVVVLYPFRLQYYRFDVDQGTALGQCNQGCVQDIALSFMWGKVLRNVESVRKIKIYLLDVIFVKLPTFKDPELLNPIVNPRVDESPHLWD